MNEVITAARAAREQLSSALAALQAPEAANLMDTVTGPVATAMGALHEIEASEGVALPICGLEALVAVRRALAALQAVPSDHPAAGGVTASVAGSLGLVFQIAQKAMRAGPVPPGLPDPSNDRWEEAAEPTPSSPRVREPLPQTHVVRRGEFAVTAPEAPRPRQGRAVGLPSDAPEVVTEATPSMPVPAPPRPPNAVDVEAALGAHSATNFYKGLTGSDVVDGGGLFIATYQIPPIGQELWIKVALPGGYEFEASGQVAWTRESGSGDAPPGFGARFREISPEARRLVYRYVRNREPLFHDDL